MSEVASVGNDLDVAVLPGESLQYRQGVVAGGVVDEGVLVSVAAQRCHYCAHPLVQFLYVLLLVVAGSHDANGFHTRSSYVSIGGIKRLLSNSSLDRKGCISSGGGETILPSGSCLARTRGSKACSGSSITSASIGPSEASTSSVTVSKLFLSISRAGTP